METKLKVDIIEGNDIPNTSLRTNIPINKGMEKLIKDKIKKDEYENLNFLKFVVLNTKIISNYESFVSLLLFSSLLEIFIWIVTLTFLIVQNIKKYYMAFGLILHIPKAIIGLVALSQLPSSQEIINQIDESDNKIDLIKESIITNILYVLDSKSIKVQSVLLPYLILTIINMIIQVAIFIYEMWTFSNNNSEWYYMLDWAILWIFTLK